MSVAPGLRARTPLLTRNFLRPVCRPSSYRASPFAAVSLLPRRATHTGPADNDAGIPSHNYAPRLVQRKRRIVVGITGASGAVFSIRLLEILRELDIETHLILSKWALATMRYETDLPAEYLHSLATKSYVMKDMAAPPSSGSFLHDGMIIVPCSMKTLAAVRAGYCDDLISRSADVCLKEQRKLVLVVRETPLSAVHLDNMAFLQRAGATIFPPVPAFYTRPKSIQDIIDQSVGRMLDSLGIHVDNFERWEGMRP